MAEKMKLFLYLARRDKTGIKVISTFNGESLPPTRVSDLSLLNIPKTILPEISKIVQKHKMYWEPWIESADSFLGLKRSLENRGYKKIPSSSYPSPSLRGETIDTSNVPVKKTMVRKRSS